MNYFTLQPDVYSTSEKFQSLPDLLDLMWKSAETEKEAFYIVSGFSNFNGGVRFYDMFEDHINSGGTVIAILGGSTSQRLSTIQVVRELVSRGVHVKVVNRKRLMHAKLYGRASDSDQNLVTSSGNFTGPGMMMNVEGTFMADSKTLTDMNFNWKKLISEIEKQKWQTFDIEGEFDENAPYVGLLYDEEKHGRNNRQVYADFTEYLVTTLSSNDTSRIIEKKIGTQYIWLSKDVTGYFPPLLIRNKRGRKKTYSALIKINYPQLNMYDIDSRVTFEAENNLDFRLGTTAKLNGTKIAKAGDLAIVKKIDDTKYEIFFISTNDKKNFSAIGAYATRFIGHQGKRYGFIPSDEFEKYMGNS